MAHDEHYCPTEGERSEIRLVDLDLPWSKKEGSGEP